MPSRKVDVIVLGAGIVGVSAALALQARGRTVAIVDRCRRRRARRASATAASSRARRVIPYVFPREPGEIVRAALNRDPRAHIRYGALPSIAPALWRYFQASTPARKNATAKAMAPLLAGASAEHLKLAHAAGAGALLRGGGWIKAYRSARGQDLAHEDTEELKPYGVTPVVLDRAALDRARAACRRGGDRRRPLPRAADDAGPAGAGAKLCGAVLQARRPDGKGRRASLEPAGAGWMVTTAAGRLAARDVVIALGPWSDELAR